MKLKGKIAIVTGASRGVGKAIARRLGREGAKIVVVGKTETPHPTLPGTIHETVAEVKSQGGEAIAVGMDVRDDHHVEALAKKTKEHFGRIDILIHNAGAIWLRPFLETPMKRFDLVMDVNVRAAYSLMQAVVPIMEENGGGHILTMSPKLSARHIVPCAAYNISKMGMTLLVEYLREEFREKNIAINTLWPVTLIESEATRHFQMGSPKDWRSPTILADAVLEIVSRPPSQFSGNAVSDEEILRSAGVTDFSKYRADPAAEPKPLWK